MELAAFHFHSTFFVLSVSTAPKCWTQKRFSRLSCKYFGWGELRFQIELNSRNRCHITWHLILPNTRKWEKCEDASLLRSIDYEFDAGLQCSSVLSMMRSLLINIKYFSDFSLPKHRQKQFLSLQLADLLFDISLFHGRISVMFSYSLNCFVIFDEMFHREFSLFHFNNEKRLFWQLKNSPEIHHSSFTRAPFRFLFFYSCRGGTTTWLRSFMIRLAVYFMRKRQAQNDF